MGMIGIDELLSALETASGTPSIDTWLAKNEISDPDIRAMMERMSEEYDVELEALMCTFMIGFETAMKYGKKK